MSTDTMARPKAKGKQSPDDQVLVTIKCRREWRDWLDSIAKARRVSVSSLIDQMAADLAREYGLPAPPPRWEGRD